MIHFMYVSIIVAVFFMIFGTLISTLLRFMLMNISLILWLVGFVAMIYGMRYVAVHNSQTVSQIGFYFGCFLVVATPVLLIIGVRNGTAQTKHD